MYIQVIQDSSITNAQVLISSSNQMSIYHKQTPNQLDAIPDNSPFIQQARCFVQTQINGLG